MTGSLALLCVALAAVDAPVREDAGDVEAAATAVERGIALSASSTWRPSASGVLLAQRASAPPRTGDGDTVPNPGTPTVVTRRATVDDAPTTPAVSFLASSLTSFTGFAGLIGLLASPPNNLPLGGLNWRGRLGASLLLMSVGPSMGDLLNHDTAGFLVGAVARTAIAGMSWGAIELVAASSGTSSSTQALLVVGTVLFVSVGSLIWTGWCAVDLIRSLFAPQRWVDRTNAELRTRAPISEVRQTGGLRAVR